MQRRARVAMGTHTCTAQLFLQFSLRIAYDVRIQIVLQLWEGIRRNIADADGRAVNGHSRR